MDVETKTWDIIHEGMRRVVETHKQFDDLMIDVSGKTGTAETDLRHPNHGLFIGFAPSYEPQYAIAVRIANGYSSGNACLAADDVFKYLFQLVPEEMILTGYASDDTSETSND
jgi:penicillin-binding protein 2